MMLWCTTLTCTAAPRTAAPMPITAHACRCGETIGICDPASLRAAALARAHSLAQTLRGLARLEEQDRDLSEVKVDKVLRLVRDV